MTFISLFSDENGFLATDQRVFSAEELQPLQQAIEQAQQLNKRLSDQRDKEAQTFKAASEQGYADGLAKGHEQARLQVAETLSDWQQRFQRTVQETQASSASLAVDIVRKIAGQIQTDEWLLAQALRASEDLVDQPAVKLRIHATQVAPVKQRIDSLAHSPVSQIIADESLATDGCVLETPLGQVEVDLETQLNRILALFADHQPESSSSGG